MEVFLFVGFIVLIILLRVVAGFIDGDRILRHFRARGDTVNETKWCPFGPGWFGTQHARIYDITYRDSLGHVYRAYVKTSMLSGVYVTEDRLIERAADDLVETPTPEADLRAENERLRQRI